MNKNELVQFEEEINIVAQVQVVPEQKHDLLNIIKYFNEICNWLSEIAFREKIFSWLPLQRRVYRELREKGLPASEIVALVRKVAYAYKGKRKYRVTFQSLGSIPLYRHSYKKNNIVAFYGHHFPFLSRRDIELSSKHQATLSYDKSSKKFFIHQVIEKEVPELYKPEGYLGCDLGIKNILADSDEKLYSSRHLNGLRKRHRKLRARLQSIGTSSARRLLVKRRRKEGRFSRWVNHNISKEVVNKAKNTLRGIALENLKHIRERITVAKSQRYVHNSWSFGQLRAFLTYKAALNGVPLVMVDPKNTSRTCPVCGYVDKANRKTQSEFRCLKCNTSGIADIIAARNIASRAAGNQPNATG